MESTVKIFDNPAETAVYAPGQVIFQKNETGDFMFMVIEGAVDITVHGRVIDTVKPGGFFGEMALIEDKPRSATAVAKESTKVARVDRQKFQHLVQRTPAFALELMRVMADRLRRLNQRL
ncbi:MAG: cyclic nucleotide-binding domain-containing protein [Opitutaceae bacterium]|nr:cyclic nucleotide-binding domain-containing protein [Opitutaceae bacterium]